MSEPTGIGPQCFPNSHVYVGGPTCRCGKVNPAAAPLSMEGTTADDGISYPRKSAPVGNTSPLSLERERVVLDYLDAIKKLTPEVYDTLIMLRDENESLRAALSSSRRELDLAQATIETLDRENDELTADIANWRGAASDQGER